MITTTLNRIREHGPCSSGWRKLLAHLGKTEADDAPVPFSVIVEACGIDDALWCCRAEPQHSREWRLFAVRCARSQQHLMTDPRSLAALDVAERHANGLATDAELFVARDAAWDAARGAAEGAVEGAFRDAAWSAAWSAVWAATRDAARDAACSAACSAARADARADAWAAFKADFLTVVGEVAV